MARPRFRALVWKKMTTIPTDKAARHENVFRVLFVSIVLLVGWLLWAHGAPVQRVFPWDLPVLLEGAWRVFQGQIPFVDFHTQLGPVTYFIIALGMRLTGPCVGAIACGNAIMFVALSAWAWGLGRARMSSSFKFLVALCVGFTVAGTACHGYRFIDTSYASMYDRYGEAFMALILLESFGRVRQPGGWWTSLAGGFSSGAVLVLLFFLKLDFFGIAAMAIAAGAVLRSYPRSRWIGLALGTLLVMGLMLAYLRFDLPALKDSLILTVAPRLGRIRSDLPAIILNRMPWAPIYMMAALWWIAPTPERASRAWINPKMEQGLMVLCIVLAQFVLFCTCGQPPVPILFSFAALLLLQARHEQSPGDAKMGLQKVDAGPTSSAAWQSACLLAAFLIGSMLLHDMASVAYSTYRDRMAAPRCRFASSSMADMIVTRYPDYVEEVNDGFELLRKHSKPSDRVFAMTMSNPFPFGLLRPCPKGQTGGLDPTITFSRSAHLDPERLFADVSVVMVPRCESLKAPDVEPASLLLKSLMEVYGTTFSKYFTQAAQSEYWVLYRCK